MEVVLQFFVFFVTFLLGEQLLVAILMTSGRELSLRRNADWHYAWQNQDPLLFNPTKHPNKPVLSHPVHPDDYFVPKEEEE